MNEGNTDWAICETDCVESGVNNADSSTKPRSVGNT